MALKRVVVTGLGALTPIGNNLKDFRSGLIAGKAVQLLSLILILRNLRQNLLVN